MNTGAPIENVALRRSATLSAATIFLAVEGILWCAALAGVNLVLQSGCDQLGLSNCSHVDARYLVAGAVPGILGIAVAFPLWQRRRWAWVVALTMQGLLAAAVAYATLAPLLAANPAGRSGGQFASDLAVGLVLTLLRLAVFEIPQAAIIALLLTPSARRSLRRTV